MAWSKRLLPAAPASHTGTTSNSHGPSPTQLFASAAGEAVQDGPGKQWRTARASSGGQPGEAVEDGPRTWPGTHRRDLDDGSGSGLA